MGLIEQVGAKEKFMGLGENQTKIIAIELAEVVGNWRRTRAEFVGLLIWSVSL